MLWKTKSTDLDARLSLLNHIQRWTFKLGGGEVFNKSQKVRNNSLRILVCKGWIWADRGLPWLRNLVSTVQDCILEESLGHEAGNDWGPKGVFDSWWRKWNKKEKFRHRFGQCEQWWVLSALPSQISCLFGFGLPWDSSFLGPEAKLSISLHTPASFFPVLPGPTWTSIHVPLFSQSQIVKMWLLCHLSSVSSHLITWLSWVICYLGKW